MSCNITFKQFRLVVLHQQGAECNAFGSKAPARRSKWHQNDRPGIRFSKDQVTFRTWKQIL